MGEEVSRWKVGVAGSKGKVMVVRGGVVGEGK